MDKMSPGGFVPANDGNPAPYVLVVDDEPIIREEIVEYLQLRGVRALSVANGHDALTCLKADPSITVILSDIRMPDMDGLTLAASAIAIAGEEHAIEVALLTGHATVDDAAAAARLRAIDFLEKPAPLADIKSALMRAHLSAAERRTKWRGVQALEAESTKARRAIDSLLSDRDRLRQQLLRSAEPHASPQRDTFMAVMNHELRTPLVPIIGLAELIEVASGTLSVRQITESAWGASGWSARCPALPNLPIWYLATTRSRERLAGRIGQCSRSASYAPPGSANGGKPCGWMC
jgi:CheY-like chemotaxis protein